MIKNSHMEWVEMLYQKYSDMVFRTGVIYLKSEQEAYDIVQEVFLKLLNHPRQFKDEDHEKAWILRVAINCCKDLLKSSWRKKRISWDEYEDGGESYIRGWEDDGGRELETKHMVLDAIRNLPAMYREVIYLFYYEEYTAEEIGRLIHKNASTIRSRLQKARELLRIEIKGEWI